MPAAPLDRAAAVLAVGLLGRVSNHVHVDFLNLAATGQKFFHGASQGIALFLLGFNARQRFYVDGGFGFGLALFGSRNAILIAIIVAVVITDTVIGSFQLLGFFFVGAF